MNARILSEELDKALQASEEIIDCIAQGDWEKVNTLNYIRMKLIRMLSRCQNNDISWQEFGERLYRMKALDQQILTSSKKAHKATMVQIQKTRANKEGCAFYKQQNQL